MMKILILNWRDISHPLAGGAEISLWEQAKIWKEKQSDITWFSSSFPHAKSEEIIDGIKVIRRGSHFTVHLHAFFYFLKHRLSNQTIIIDSFHFLPFFTPLYLRKQKKLALINEVAGQVWFDNLPSLLAWIGYYLEPLFFKLYTSILFITASSSTQKELVNLGINPKHISIVPHGVTILNPADSIQKEKEPTILFLNRISKDKGIEDALKAFSIVKQKISNVKLWIVGKEQSEGELKRVMKSIPYQYKDSITYFGFVDQKKKFELLKEAWVLIHPSKKEGWGLTVIEAASQDTPTVGYNVEGLRDSILHRRTGLLVNQNPESLAEGIVELVKNEEFYSGVCQEAKIWSKNFNWRKSGLKSWQIITSK